MNECQAFVEQYVDDNGGRVLYDDLKNAMPGQLIRYLPSVLRNMKAAGAMMKQNRVADGNVLFEVFRPGAPVG